MPHRHGLLTPSLAKTANLNSEQTIVRSATDGHCVISLFGAPFGACAVIDADANLKSTRPHRIRSR